MIVKFDDLKAPESFVSCFEKQVARQVAARRKANING